MSVVLVAVPRRFRMSVCPKCGTSNPDNIVYCRKCGSQMPFGGSNANKDVLEQAPALSASEILKDVRPPREHREASPTLKVGAVSAMVAGVLAIVQGIISIAGIAAISSIVDFGDLAVYGVLLGLGELVLGFLSFQGGVFALNAKNYSRALIGSVLGMVALGFVVGALLGLVAVILIALCRDEFPDSKPAAA